MALFGGMKSEECEGKIIAIYYTEYKIFTTFAE